MAGADSYVDRDVALRMIHFEGVSKRFAEGMTAIDALDPTIESGELTMLAGPTGCGKTMTLRLLNRLEEPSRGIGYVMQHSGLLRTIRAYVSVKC